MINFSTKLKYYLERSNYTISSFAKANEIDRSLLHKYTTGSRIPKDSSFIDLISEKLLLSVAEYDEIYKLWKRESVGSRLFLQREKIKDLLENFNIYDNFTIPEVSFQSFDIDSFPKFKITTNQHELLILIRSILSFESNKEAFPISICMQPQYSGITNILSDFSSLENLSVTHLVCFHQHRDSFIHNISLIENLLSLSFCINEYKIKVYYDNASQHINQMSLLPNLIITDEFVILASYDLGNGIIYHQKDIHNFYQNMFSEMSAACKLITRTCTTSSDYHQFFFDHTFHYGMTQSPQMGMIATREIFEEVIHKNLDHREEFINLAIGSSERLKVEYQKKNYCFYFTDNGAKDFIEIGRNTEFPSVLYRPLTKQESIDSIKLYLKDAAGKFVRNNMLNNKHLNYTSNIIIYLEVGKSVIFQKPTENGFPKVIFFEETSFNEMMLDFFDNMEEMGYSLSFEESTSYLKKLAE